MNLKEFPRKIYPQLKEHLTARQTTVLTGMRRTGKTTLIKQLLSEIGSANKLYLDLQSINNQEIFLEKNFDNIMVKFQEYGLKTDQKIFLAIDEIQLLPKIAGVIKYLYDHYDIKFIVSGSSSYYLKNLFSESLSGRKRIFELFPLDFGEFLDFKQIPHLKNKNLSKLKFNAHEYARINAYYQEFIEYGGFPEVVLAGSDRDKINLLNDIISSYINIDIKFLADLKKSEEIFKLIRMLASRAGTKLDYSKLSRLTGLSRAHVASYIELFEKTYLIALAPVHTKNPDREIVKAKKIYFSDSGLLNILTDAAGGVKFENALFAQIRHHGALSYYSLKTGREIDFVLNGQTALEAKETPTTSDLANLKALAKIAGLKTFRLIGRHQSPKFSDYIWGGDIR